ncbi:MAG: hypothetical protein R3223_09005, partial [Longimicrobiales bacterium]|nr:hypothetical protein [Longimicrobiales bacterium]
GACGSFMAQGSGEDESGRADPAAVAGALGLYHSGRGAVLADQGSGLTPEDVIDHLARALRESGPGVTDLDLPFVLYDQDAPR